MRCDEFGVKNPHEGDCGTNREMEEMRKIISRLVLENLYTKIELKKMNERIEKLENRILWGQLLTCLSLFGSA